MSRTVLLVGDPVFPAVPPWMIIGEYLRSQQVSVTGLEAEYVRGVWSTLHWVRGGCGSAPLGAVTGEADTSRLLTIHHAVDRMAHGRGPSAPDASQPYLCGVELTVQWLLTGHTVFGLQARPLDLFGVAEAHRLPATEFLVPALAQAVETMNNVIPAGPALGAKRAPSSLAASDR